MKITSVVSQILRIPSVQAKTASSQDSVLVRVRTEDGLRPVTSGTVRLADEPDRPSLIIPGLGSARPGA